MSSQDLNRNKVYLICHAVRIGAMDMKDNDTKRNSMANAVLNVSHKKHSQMNITSNGSNGNASEQMTLRRPFGVAAIDLTPIIRKPEDFKNNLDLPFILCEKEYLDNTLKKLLTNKDVGKIDSKLAVSVELLHGDIKQVMNDTFKIFYKLRTVWRATHSIVICKQRRRKTYQFQFILLTFIEFVEMHSSDGDNQILSKHI